MQHTQPLTSPCLRHKELCLSWTLNSTSLAKKRNEHIGLIKLAKSKTIQVSLKYWLLSTRELGSPIKKMIEVWSFSPVFFKKIPHTTLQIITEAHSLIHSMDYRSTEAQCLQVNSLDLCCRSEVSVSLLVVRFGRGTDYLLTEAIRFPSHLPSFVFIPATLHQVFPCSNLSGFSCCHVRGHLIRSDPPR